MRRKRISYRCIYVRYKGEVKRVMEHRLIWERAYGKIPAGYEVHHKNGDPRDNRLFNLIILIHLIHMRLHHPAYRLLPDGRWLKRCPDCRRIKPLEDFHHTDKHPKSCDYHLYVCKICKRVYRRKAYRTSSVGRRRGDYKRKAS